MRGNFVGATFAGRFKFDGCSDDRNGIAYLLAPTRDGGLRSKIRVADRTDWRHADTPGGMACLFSLSGAIASELRSLRQFSGFSRTDRSRLRNRIQPRMPIWNGACKNWKKRFSS